MSYRNVSGSLAHWHSGADLTGSPASRHPGYRASLLNQLFSRLWPDPAARMRVVEPDPRRPLNGSFRVRVRGRIPLHATIWALARTPGARDWNLLGSLKPGERPGEWIETFASAGEEDLELAVAVCGDRTSHRCEIRLKSEPAGALPRSLHPPLVLRLSRAAHKVAF
ncbi:MAG: hypothetical protein K2X35_02945 [Bryobacteraceae bacterium]|nr:hypothetical protein [Bryobacteraceae bacterium]